MLTNEQLEKFKRFGEIVDREIDKMRRNKEVIIAIKTREIGGQLNISIDMHGEISESEMASVVTHFLMSVEGAMNTKVVLNGMEGYVSNKEEQKNG